MEKQQIMLLDGSLFIHLLNSQLAADFILPGGLERPTDKSSSCIDE